MPHITPVERGVRAAISAALILCASQPVSADDTESTESVEPGGLAEVMVTARRRAERLQETPVAVTALSADALAERSITSVDDIAAYVPNMSSTPGPGGGSAGNYFLRGIGQWDYVVTFDPGVGTYVDGVYLGRAQGASLDLLDVERIEVLRGPQGTLFGRNTIGGAINIVTAEPSDTFGGNANVMLGNYQKGRAAVSLDLPLASGKVRSRFSVLGSTEEGYMRALAAPDEFNPAGLGRGEFGDSRTVGARAVFHIDASEDAKIKLTADWTRGRGSADPHNVEAVDPAFGYDPRYVTGSFRDTYAGFRAPDDLDVWGVSGTLEWELGDLQLKSITSLRDMENRTGVDFDGSPLLLLDNAVRTEQQQLSQEVQLIGTAANGRLSWLAGVYYFEEDIEQQILLWMFGTPFWQDIDPVGESIGAYVHADHDLTEKLSVTLGGRYTHEKKDTFFDFRLDMGGTLTPIFPPQSQADSWTSFTPKLGLEYKLTLDAMVYASYSEGFRSGGVNGRPFTANELTSFDPETVQAYEIGAKTEWLDRRLQLNAALFYSRYEDMQLPTMMLTPEGTSIISTDNAGVAELYGGELELLFRPSAALDLNASVGFLKNHYLSLRPNPSIERDDKLPYAPEWTLAVGAQYALPVLANHGELALRADWSHVSRMSYWPANNPRDFEDGYELLNLRLRYRPTQGAWEISAFATNLLDEEYYALREDVLSSFGASINWPGAPRQWGAELRIHF